MIYKVGWRPDWRWHDLLLDYALSCVKTYTTGGQTRANAYNADGVLVAQTTGSITTYYTQDLAWPLSQVLNSGGVNYCNQDEVMPARDRYHNHVRTALQRDDWTASACKSPDTISRV